MNNNNNKYHKCSNDNEKEWNKLIKEYENVQLQIKETKDNKNKQKELIKYLTTLEKEIHDSLKDNKKSATKSSISLQENNENIMEGEFSENLTTYPNNPNEDMALFYIMLNMKIPNSDWNRFKKALLEKNESKALFQILVQELNNNRKEEAQYILKEFFRRYSWNGYNLMTNNNNFQKYARKNFSSLEIY